MHRDKKRIFEVNLIKYMTPAAALISTALLLAHPMSAFAQTSAASGAVSRPNIVFILTDNLGYGDIGVYGGGEMRNAPTPRIDQLAHEGLQMTNFNVEPECTPSRSALMTGRLPVRSGTSNVPLPGVPQGISPWEYTLAQLLHDSGYQTAMYGKWHLGDTQGRMPNDRGFDEWWGFLHSSGETTNNIQPGWSADQSPIQDIWQGKRGEKSVAVGKYDYAERPLMDATITRKSVEYIKTHANDGKPFFLYVPFSLPHSPPIPNPAFRDPNRTDYQNVLTEIDHNTGEILDALKAAGIEKNTIVVWASDNGPETLQGQGINYGAQGDPGPFRGEFPSGWEGAFRVPGIIRWPAEIPAGRVSNEIVSMLDFYRTFARVAGASDRVPTDRPIDSIDETDFFEGKQKKSNRESVMIFWDKDLLAVKWRNFKVHFIVNAPSHGDVQQAGQSQITSIREKLVYPWVFDVSNDPKELWNIAGSSQWLARPVGKIAAQFQQSVKKYPNVSPGAEGPKPPQ